MEKYIRHKIVFFLLLLYWPFLFFGMHASPEKISRFVRHVVYLDKVLHFSAYFVLAFLFWFSLKPKGRVSWKSPRPWFVLFIILVYAMIDEALQGFFGRSPEFLDLLSDLGGALICLLMLTLFEFLTGAMIVLSGLIFLFFWLCAKDAIIVNPLFMDAIVGCGFFALSLIWRLYLLNHKEVKKTITLRSFILPVIILACGEVISIAVGGGFEISTVAGALAGIIIFNLLVFGRDKVMACQNG